MKDVISLHCLKVGETARVQSISNATTIKRRLLDFGLIEGTCVECVMHSPAGELTAYKIRGAVIAIRKEDSEHISVII